MSARILSWGTLVVLLFLAPAIVVAQSGNAPCGADAQPPCGPGQTCTPDGALGPDGLCHRTQAPCGAPGEPSCPGGSGPGNNGCQDPNTCGCPGPQGNSDLAQPGVQMAQDSANRFGGQSLVAGLANDITLVATNPLKTAFAGELRLIARDATILNATRFNLTLAPFSEQRIPVRVTPPPDASLNNGFGVETRLNGTAGASPICVQSGLGSQLSPPVSIDWVAPLPNSAMLPIEALLLPNGNGIQGGGAEPAFGSAHRIVVRATNRANVTSSAFYLIPSVNQQTVSDGVAVDPLAPGESRAIDLGAIPPPPTDCGGPVFKPGCGGGAYITVGWATRIDVASNRGTSIATSFAAPAGVVRSAKPLVLSLQDPASVEPFAEGAAQATLGKPYVVKINVTNFGATTNANNPIHVAFVPPFRAKYDVQSEESSDFLVTTRPGESLLREASFTPLVTGRWEVLVYFIPPGSSCCAQNAFTFEVPGDVNVSVPTSVPALFHVGESARAPILVRSDEALVGATLRVTTAPQAQGGDGGGPRLAGDKLQSVVGGLTQTLVAADPASVPLGDVAAGSALWSNVTVTSRASGVYNVVPYVVAGGFAYTGAPLAQDNQGPPTARPEYTPQFTIAFDALEIPLGLAFAPALVALVAGAGAFVARRLWVR